eukprot:scaffold4328_cov135-Isochrysis_galbana.AAC.10
MGTRSILGTTSWRGGTETLHKKELGKQEGSGPAKTGRRVQKGAASKVSSRLPGEGMARPVSYQRGFCLGPRDDKYYLARVLVRACTRGCFKARYHSCIKLLRQI